MSRIDSTFGRPELAAVRAAATRGDLRALSATLTTGLAGAHDRLDRMWEAVDALTARAGTAVPAGLDDWLRAEPGNPTALALRGGAEVGRAWEVRGSAPARQTRPERLHAFQAALADAERLCHAAAQADPRDPAPWAFLLQSARGRQLDTGEVLRRRDELEARAPQHLRSQAHAAIALGPMWGGSTQLAVETVRTWLRSAPAGSTLPALFFVVQFQRFPQEGRGFASDPAVREEGTRMAARLPEHPARTPDEFLAHNYAAGWFALTREPGRANHHFKLLQGYATEQPWTSLGDATGQRAIAVFRGKRQNAMLRLPI
ncbi:hypothetical protein Dvina_30295 [Dactylosporangium vinaceum]|uniref:DUF4034 domain-containing protein n=1 Tax=Dactylosporangium vinaceum TaxID=53362 RepID=A0ABV5LZF7_9ACTN|nr:hypothetical protein [Dactylosporangium vinaceum]UAB92620.1 hypothetical protein Dvina_30295 [Dactylosporangium vinaceum]